MWVFHLFNDIREGNISYFDLYNHALKATEKHPKSIDLFIKEIDLYIFSEQLELESEISDLLNKIFDKDYKPLDKNEVKLKYNSAYRKEVFVYELCKSRGFNSWFDLPHRIEKNHFTGGENRHTDLIKIFFPYEFVDLIKLKKDLLEFVEPSKKDQPKNTKFHVDEFGRNWNTADRFDLFNALGFTKQLDESDLSEDEKNDILAIILKSTREYCRKTKYATTRTNANRTNEIEYFKQKFKTSKK